MSPLERKRGSLAEQTYGMNLDDFGKTLVLSSVMRFYLLPSPLFGRVDGLVGWNLDGIKSKRTIHCIIQKG